MADIKKKMRKIQLAMIFAIIVFLILLVTMFVVFSGVFILQKLGFNLVDEISKVPLLTFAIVSVSVGTVLAFLFSRLPLKRFVRRRIKLPKAITALESIFKDQRNSYSLQIALTIWRRSFAAWKCCAQILSTTFHISSKRPLSPSVDLKC